MHKQHDFDDCKCCQQPSYCLTCGFTRLELEQAEEIRRLKAQMKERHRDYAKTISHLANAIERLWAVYERGTA